MLFIAIAWPARRLWVDDLWTLTRRKAQAKILDKCFRDGELCSAHPRKMQHLSKRRSSVKIGLCRRALPNAYVRPPKLNFSHAQGPGRRARSSGGACRHGFMERRSGRPMVKRCDRWGHLDRIKDHRRRSRCSLLRIPSGYASKAKIYFSDAAGNDTTLQES